MNMLVVAVVVAEDVVGSSLRLLRFGGHVLVGIVVRALTNPRVKANAGGICKQFKLVEESSIIVSLGLYLQMLTNCRDVTVEAIVGYS